MTVGSLVSEVFCVSYLQEGKKNPLINTHFYGIQLEERKEIEE